MNGMRIVQLALEHTQLSFDKLYSYRLPDGLSVLPGARVMAPFGAKNRYRQGIVVSVQEGEGKALKEVVSVLDPQPLLDEKMMQLVFWLKERTFCTVFDAVRAMLPTGLYWRITPLYYAVQPLPEDCLPEWCGAAAAVRRCRAGCTREKLCALMGWDPAGDLPEQAVAAGALRRDEDALRRAGDATMRMARLSDDAQQRMQTEKWTDKQAAVLQLLEQTGTAAVREICYFCGVTQAVVKTLENKGMLVCSDEERLRMPERHAAVQPAAPAALSGPQQAVYDGLLAQMQRPEASAALLYGVTGSGKTQVYMNLIDRVLEEGRQAIVLVPEISLTPQMLQTFYARYGSRVAVLHSALSIGERMDEWKRIKRGDAGVVVGTRSAVFAPCERLGLIVLDEEQENTYKSEASPRYHARDVAKYRCVQHGALLLLASATPSVETAYAARSGRYTLYQLDARYGSAVLPQVQVADMRAEEQAGRSIGHTLEAAIRQCLDEGRQAILLLNRRGYNTFISCRSCGHVLSCPSCSISMTYHRANHRLMCHYCGAMRQPEKVCPHCGSDKLRYSGLGTQRLEEEVQELFPGVPVLRMDTDTTLSRFAYEKKFAAFAAGEYRLMIGTQMVAKGLDFPQVGLVGVISADQALYGDDYRCYETAFSLLTQVIGRAGRRQTPGLAVVQTYTPENPVIHLAARQDYWRFYETEVATRRMIKYPPFSDLCQFAFSGEKEQAVQSAARRFLELLRTAVQGPYAGIPMIALDPVPASVLRVAGRYRYKIIVKTRNSSRLREMIRGLLQTFAAQPEGRGTAVTADINPADIL
ncbi:MAG: primosomal protein N' [Clostridia bacterium]|nr:primosomal protein N' [Clostridia bacterium]